MYKYSHGANLAQLYKCELVKKRAILSSMAELFQQFS